MDDLAEVSATEAPFTLPGSWLWTRIGLAMNLVNGRAFKPKDWSATGLPIIRIQNLNDENAPFNYCNFEVEPRHHLKPGDLLISWSGTPGTSFGAFVWKGAEGVLNQHIFRAEVYGAAYDVGFLKIAINGRLDEMIAQAHGGVGLRHITKGKLEAMPIPLPPMADQKRIVAKVGQLMALCDDLEARQAKKREIGTRLTKSALEILTTAETPAEFDAAWKRVVANFDVLLDRSEQVRRVRDAIVELAVRGTLVRQRHEDEGVDALRVRINAERSAVVAKGGRVPLPPPLEQGDAPYAVPRAWRWVRWGELVLGSDSGWSPQCESRPRQGEEWGVVKVSAVSWRTFLPDENKALPEGQAARPECAIHKGDFLMSRANTAELVGRSVIVDREPVRLMMSDKIVRCTFAGAVDKRYLNLFNQTAAARAHYIANASGTSDSMKNVSRDAVFSMPVALPPLAEQQRIVAKVEHLTKLCDDLEAKLRRAEDRAAKLAQAAVVELVG